MTPGGPRLPLNRSGERFGGLRRIYP